MTRARVLLVGGGLTSAAIACRLSQLPVTITCWDKATKPGAGASDKLNAGRAETPEYYCLEFQHT